MSPHLAVPAFVDGDDERRRPWRRAAAGSPRPAPARAAAVDHEAASKAVEIVVVRAHRARAPDKRARPRGVDASGGPPVAVVGQEQQTLGVEVEPPDGVDVLTDPTEQIDDRRAPLRIRSGRHVARGLFSSRYRCRSTTLTRRPSTRMSSSEGSALVPSSITVAPLTSHGPRASTARTPAATRRQPARGSSAVAPRVRFNHESTKTRNEYRR